ncbi:hypothetical protein LIER_13382 [Lithospermum erythrorhizon]|uniref:Uncharacterized protein n=1 Tax=Lithospermum erythrorhizon TaxID=34254 RepID=A0AAV3Q0F5_LITER
MLYRLLKFYIQLRGLDWGIIKNLPYHPQYPFLTTFELNDDFLDRVSKDAYLILWYLAKVCTFKLHISADALLRYLAKCLLTDQDREFKVFHKWLTLFHDTTWWQENICKTMSIMSVNVTFRIKTTIFQEGRNMKIQKEFEAKMASELRICAIIRTDHSGPNILTQVIEASIQARFKIIFPPKLREKICRWLFRYYNIPPRPAQDFGPTATFILHD